MSILEIMSINPTITRFENSKPLTIDDFLQITTKDLITQHHRRNGQFTYFLFKNDNINDELLFIVSQDKSFIKEFKMLQPSSFTNKIDSIDLFEEDKSQLETIKIGNLIMNLEDNKALFHLSNEGKEYSFMLLKGNESKELVESINLYIDESENIADYKTNKIKANKV